MSEVIDWVVNHALALVGGALLFVGAAALIVYAFKHVGTKHEQALANKDPREGE